jgi:hypothetical protein
LKSVHRDVSLPVKSAGNKPEGALPQLKFTSELKPVEETDQQHDPAPSGQPPETELEDYFNMLCDLDGKVNDAHITIAEDPQSDQSAKHLSSAMGDLSTMVKILGRMVSHIRKGTTGMMKQPSNDPMIETTIRLPRSLSRMLTEAAHSLGIPKAEFIRRTLFAAIEHWRRNQAPQVIERLKAITGVGR